MPLTHIEYASLASSAVMNDNFEYLDDRVTAVANSLTSAVSSINSSISTVNSALSQKDEDLDDDISSLDTRLTTLEDDFSSYDITPDYEKAITVYNSSGGGQLNIDWEGWLAFNLYCHQVAADFQFYVDGVMVGATASDENDRAAGIVLVKSGSVATWNGSQSIVIKKVPFVGG